MGRAPRRLARVLVTVLLVAACAGPGATPSAAPMVTPAPAPSATGTAGDPRAIALRDAAAATLQASPFSIRQTVLVNGSSVGTDGQTASVSGTASFGDRPAMRITGQWADTTRGTFATIVTGSLLLLRGEYLGTAIEPGKWLLVDLDSSDERAPGVAANAAGYLHTSLFLYYLYGVTRAVHDLGDESLDGIATTHYQTTIDVSAVTDAVPAAVRDRVRDQVLGLTGENAADIGLDVWIDRDGLVREVDALYAVAQASGGGKMLIIGTLASFGKPFDLDLPADADIVTLESIPMEQPTE